MGSNRNLIIAAAATALAASAGGCVFVDDDRAELILVNDSSYILTEIHLAEIRDPTWGPDLIPGDLFPGEELVITAIPCGDYDVLVVDETGLECELRDLSLCFDRAIWVIDDFTLDTCAFGF